MNVVVAFIDKSSYLTVCRYVLKYFVSVKPEINILIQRLLLDYIDIFSKMAQCKDGFPNTLALSSLLIMGSNL